MIIVKNVLVKRIPSWLVDQKQIGDEILMLTEAFCWKQNLANFITGLSNFSSHRSHIPWAARLRTMAPPKPPSCMPCTSRQTLPTELQVGTCASAPHLSVPCRGRHSHIHCPHALPHLQLLVGSPMALCHMGTLAYQLTWPCGLHCPVPPYSLGWVRPQKTGEKGR